MTLRTNIEPKTKTMHRYRTLGYIVIILPNPKKFDPCLNCLNQFLESSQLSNGLISQCIIHIIVYNLTIVY
jgi:hypothetical protein